MNTKELNDKKKEYMYSYKPLERRIEELENELEQLRESKQGAQAIRYSNMPHASRGKSDLSDYEVAKEKLCETIMLKKTACIEKKNEILNQIYKIGNSELEELLELHYIKKYGWKEVGKKMHYSRTKLHTMHSIALSKFELPK